MPPGTSEVRHRHDRARQFFFALDGTLSIELAGARFTLESGQGLHVPAGEPHRVFNDGPSAVQFLVVSQPPSHGDRRTEPGNGDRVSIAGAPNAEPAGESS
jgi:mannose-6-phosphate isomerase-like protein (cupin superfamily)